MSKQPELTISILIHDDFSHIGGALESLSVTTTTPFKVFIVINQGKQTDIEKLQQAYPQYTYILNDTSMGFAGNHNQVMKLADTPFIALLNDDIKIHPSALDTMIDYLKANPSVGLVGPRLEYADGTQQVSVYSDPSLFRMVYKISGLGRLTHQKSPIRKVLLRLGAGRLFGSSSLKMDMPTQTVDVIKGAVMLVRREVYEKVGGMDETTLSYGEEIDWHLRIRQAGWQVAYVSDAIVTHYGTGQALGELKGWQIIEDRRAILNYYLKHKPRWQSLIIRSAIVFFHGFQTLRTFIFAHSQWQSHFQTFKLGLLWSRSSVD